MAEVLKPLSPDDVPIKVGSAEIIEQFIASKLEMAEVEVEKTGRTDQSVYTALCAFLRGHPNLGVEVKLEKGRVILYRAEVPTEPAAT